MPLLYEEGNKDDMKSSFHPSQEPSSIEKIAEVDTHIGVAMSGLTADARTLIEHARVETQVALCLKQPFSFTSMCLHMHSALSPLQNFSVLMRWIFLVCIQCLPLTSACLPACMQMDLSGYHATTNLTSFEERGAAARS